MNLLTHVESYAEYYTNQEYGLLSRHRDDLTYRIGLSAVETKHSTALLTATGLSQEWPSYSNRRARMSGGLSNHICRSCDRRLVT